MVTISLKIQIEKLLRVKPGPMKKHTQAAGMNPNVPGKRGHVITLCHLLWWW